MMVTQANCTHSSLNYIPQKPRVTLLIITRWPFLTHLLSPEEGSSMKAKKTGKKKKKYLLKAILSIRKRASKLTNLNSIYQLSLLLVSNKNKSLRAVLKPKLLLCQYFPYSASWPTVIIEFESVFFMMFPGTEHERLCQSVLSWSLFPGRLAKRRRRDGTWSPCLCPHGQDN